MKQAQIADSLQQKLEAMEKALQHVLEVGLDRKAYLLIEQALRIRGNTLNTNLHA